MPHSICICTGRGIFSEELFQFSALPSGQEFPMCAYVNSCLYSIIIWCLYVHMIIVIVFYPIMIILHYRLVDLVIIRLFVIMSWYYVRQRLQCAVTRVLSSHSEGITKITISILGITSVLVNSFSPGVTLKCIAVLSVFLSLFYILLSGCFLYISFTHYRGIYMFTKYINSVKGYNELQFITDYLTHWLLITVYSTLQSILCLLASLVWPCLTFRSDL